MTKKLICALAALLMLPSLALFSFAEGEKWNTEYRRVNDFQEVLEKADETELNRRANKDIEKYKLDFVCAVFDGSGYAGEDNLGSYTKWLYTHHDFGYGVNRDGMMLGINTTTGEFKLVTFGRAKELFGQAQLYCLTVAIQKGYREDGIRGAIKEYLESAEQLAEFYDTEPIDVETDYGSGYDYDPSPLETTLPIYVTELDVDFSDNTSLPRVLDYADIFTPEQEEEMKERIAAITEAEKKDIVVLTVDSTDGYSHDIYNADFYDYCFYGFGKDHDGISLLISMDPSDRGFYTTGTGSVQPMHTEAVANALDDALYDYMRDGNYGEGVLDWINNVDVFFRKGIPFAPDWLPDLDEEKPRFHDADAPRLIDDANVLSEKTAAEAKAALSAISEKYGIDAVLHITGTSCGMSKEIYTQKFYRYNGYGLGDKYDGIMFVIFTSTGSVFTHTEGKGAELLNGDELYKITDAVENMAETKNYNAAANRAVKFTSRYLDSGRVPTTAGRWTIRGIVTLLIGMFTGSVVSTKAASTMKVVEKAADADRWTVPGSYRLLNSSDTYLNTTTTSVYIPPSDSSSSSGGGGGSSYHSSYSGSSGTSHSGSGRSF